MCGCGGGAAEERVRVYGQWVTFAVSATSAIAAPVPFQTQGERVTDFWVSNANDDHVSVTCKVSGYLVVNSTPIPDGGTAPAHWPVRSAAPSGVEMQISAERLDGTAAGAVQVSWRTVERVA